MRTLETVFTVILWIILAVILWAAWPWLVKLLVAAQALHNLGLH